MTFHSLQLTRPRHRFTWPCIRIAIIVAAAVLGMLSSGYSAAVSIEVARRVAEQQLRHHVALFGDWNGSDQPTIADAQPLYVDGSGPIAYHVKVRPGGYVLVSPDDALSPVPFYSTRAAFHPDRAGDANALESWIVPEASRKIKRLRKFRSRAAASAHGTTPSPRSARRKAKWDYLRNRTSDGLPPGRALDAAVGAMAGEQLPGRSAVSPLMTTAWGQASPFNLKTPEPPGGSCSNALTGCVATAWSQVLKYYEWPEQGTGTGDYSYLGDGSDVVDFSDAKAYDWDDMPDVLTDSSPQAQKDAVGWLMYYTGMAAETDFGCALSSSSVWASDVLARYFKYKSSLSLHSRYNDAVTPATPNYDADAWFNLIKAEVDLGRLVIFSIFSDSGGHEVVVDGYNDLDAVHINYGWEGNHDGFYNISDDDDFDGGGFDWYVDRQQYVVVGIEPDPTTASRGGGGGGGGGGCFVLSMAFWLD